MQAPSLWQLAKQRKNEIVTRHPLLTRAVKRHKNVISFFTHFIASSQKMYYQYRYFTISNKHY